MSIPITIPQVGQSIAEATIIKWFKKKGDAVQKGETLVEIGTDKINTEIPSPESGILEDILVPEGETVPIETQIALLSGDLATASTVKEQPESKPVLPKESSSEEPRYSPAVRRLADEHHISLNDVTGTGAGGRVTREDVLNFIGKQSAIEEPQLHFEPAPAKDAAIQRVQMSRMRKLIAEHMSHSRKTAADVTTFFEIDMSEAVVQRDRVKQKFQDDYGIKVTYLPFIIIAVVRALRAFPILNSSIENDTILFKKNIHIGIAVALDDGLIVPVLHEVEGKNVLDLSRALQDMSEKARSKKLSAQDLEGGTFTITNPGVFGALMGTPIIHQPQVAILGIGAVVKRPVVFGDEVTVRSMSYFSLSYDHRALDGSTADRFLAHIKNTLENNCPPAEESLT